MLEKQRYTRSGAVKTWAIEHVNQDASCAASLHVSHRGRQSLLAFLKGVLLMFTQIITEVKALCRAASRVTKFCLVT